METCWKMAIWNTKEVGQKYGDGSYRI